MAAADKKAGTGRQYRGKNRRKTENEGQRNKLAFLLPFALRRDFGIPAVFDDAEKLLREVRPDAVDNITEIGGHKPLSLLCAKHRVPCICQKPMAPSLADARSIVAAFAKARTPFFVHENWRWQTPMVALRKTLASGIIGTPFRARLTMISGFDCWSNQPALRDLERFILADLGVHILDVARVFFGEAHSLYGQIHRTLAPAVKGENVATLLLAMGPARTSVVVELGYAKTPLDRGPRPSLDRAPHRGPQGSDRARQRLPPRHDRPGTLVA
jgi:predicted dehydrogenase